MTTTTIQTIKGVTCCYETCGVLFGLEANHMEQLKHTHAWFYCPNGHQQYFLVKSEAERERERAERAENNARFWEERTRDARADRDSALHKVRAERGAKTKLQKKLSRVAHGVCPCCKRTFVNLKRHMAGQHPKFAQENSTIANSSAH